MNKATRLVVEGRQCKGGLFGQFGLTWRIALSTPMTMKNPMKQIKTFVIRALPYDGQGSLRPMLQHTEPMVELASMV
jgi:hypothetical protein